MSRTKIAVILCLFFGVIGLCYAGFVLNGSSVPFLNQPFLSNYSIKHEILPSKSRKGCYLHKDGPKWLREQKFFYCLMRENGNNTVAIVEGKKNGNVILNPRHVFGRTKYNYGPIPESQNLTKSDTEALFGKHIKSEDNHFTYKLVTNHPNLPKTDRKIVFLDMQFNSDRLYKIRLRSDDLETTDWVNVKKEGEGGET